MFLLVCRSKHEVEIRKSILVNVIKSLKMIYFLIAVSTGKPISCCQPDGDTLSPRHIHPDCSPISVPDRDPVYGQHYVRCMNYVRSLPVLRSECTFGPVEQVNSCHMLVKVEIKSFALRKCKKINSRLLNYNLKF